MADANLITLPTPTGLDERAQAEALDLRLWPGQPGQDQNRGIVARDPEPADHLEPLDVRQDQVQQDDVIFIMPGQLERFFAGIGVVHDRSGGLEHEAYAPSGCQIILDE